MAEPIKSARSAAAAEEIQRGAAIRSAVPKLRAHSARQPGGESCAACRFFFIEDLPMYGDEFGACRRNPPTSDQALMAARPVPPEYWCGEFKAVV